jgi:hypothetical protein
MKFWFRFIRYWLIDRLSLLIYFHLVIFIGWWISNLFNNRLMLRYNFLWNDWCFWRWNFLNRSRLFNFLILNFFSYVNFSDLLLFYLLYFFNLFFLFYLKFFFDLFLLFNFVLHFYLFLLFDLGLLFNYYWEFLFIQDRYLEESKLSGCVDLEVFGQLISYTKNFARLSDSKSNLEECCYLDYFILLLVKWNLNALAIS